ncbi:MAG: hypothetical protein ACFBSF_13275 [Leptolyngbyaceae cyanobacterium]
MAESILCVGRNRRNQELLSQVLTRAGYSVTVALTYEEIAAVVSQQSTTLVLLDIAGFDGRIWQVCQGFKERAIPFFIVAPPNNAHLPARHVPGNPVLIKPLVIRDLLTLIERTFQAHYEEESAPATARQQRK